MPQHLNLIIMSALLLPMTGSAILFSLVTIGLLLARAKIFQRQVYWPMLLNLFLAWIPIICAGLAIIFFLTDITNHGWITLLLLCIWFIFFPNSTYLVTEFHHLKDEQSEIPYWFDTIVILSLAMCGLMLGSFSLLLVHQMLLIYIPNITAWIIFLAYLFLSNVGIYIGRFLRFNSWDILLNPLQLWSKLGAIFNDRAKRRNLLLFASLFTIFLMTFYLFLYSAIAPITTALVAFIQRYHP